MDEHEFIRSSDRTCVKPSRALISYQDEDHFEEEVPFESGSESEEEAQFESKSEETQSELKETNYSLKLTTPPHLIFNTESQEPNSSPTHDSAL